MRLFLTKKAIRNVQTKTCNFVSIGQTIFKSSDSQFWNWPRSSISLKKLLKYGNLISNIFLPNCPERMCDNISEVFWQMIILINFDYLWNQDYWIADRLDSVNYYLTEVTKFRSHTTEIPSLSVDRPASRSSIMI